MAAQNSLVFTFEIYRGEELLERRELSDDSITIGRGPAAMVRIEDESLQDLHAVINVGDDGTVQFADLVGNGSTLVNNLPVSNGTLQNGDVIGIGAIRVVVRLADQASYADDEATRVDAPAVAIPGGYPGEETASEDAFADGDDDTPEEDVMAFVMKASASQGDAGADRSHGKVLEVAQVFGDSVLNVGHFRRGQKVTVGSHMITELKVFGFPVGTIPDSIGEILERPLEFIEISGILTSEEKNKNPFQIPSDMLPTPDEFALFEGPGGKWVCNVTDKWAGFVDEGETRRTFQEIIASGVAQKTSTGWAIPVPEEGRLVVDLGTVIFVAHQTWPGKKAIAATMNIDYPFLGIMAFMLFVTVAFFTAVALIPPPPETSQNELDDHLVDLLLEKKEEDKKPDKNPDAGEGAKAKKEEGKVGKKESKIEKAKGEKVMQKQQMDKEVAENAGLLAELRDNSALDATLGNTGMSAALNQGIGGLIGTNGTQIGSGGLGGRGGGLGGGGTADGLGGMGTKGRGAGSSGYGSGGGSFGAKGEGGIGTVGGDPIILGALDKSLIDAVIKRNMAQIRYCYQRELTKTPTLGGKITVKFVIAKDGTVSSATTKSTTMGNSTVESCINSRFMRFTFPEPKGGGIVIVSYPFIFSPG